MNTASTWRWPVRRRAAVLRPAGLIGVLIGIVVGLSPAVATPISALVFSPDGGALVSGGAGRIDVRAPGDGTIQRHISCQLSRIAGLAFGRGGRVLAVAGGTPGVEGAAIILDWPEGRELHRCPSGDDLANAIAFQPNGEGFAVAGADHQVRWFGWPHDGQAPEPGRSLAGHAAPVLNLAFSPNGEILVTVGADRSVKVWSAKDGQLLRSFGHHTEIVHALAFRPEPSRHTPAESPITCATAGDDRTVRIWQPALGRMVRIIRRHEGPVFALAYTPDGQDLFAAGSEGLIRRLDPESDTLREQMAIGGDWIYALAISPDGSLLASGDWAGSVRVRPISRWKTPSVSNSTPPAGP